MKNFVVIGSCLSGSIAKKLVQMGYNLLKAVHHQRVDAISVFFAGDKSIGDLTSKIKDFLTKHEPANDKAGRRFRHRMLAHNRENLSALREAIVQAALMTTKSSVTKFFWNWAD